MPTSYARISLFVFLLAQLLPAAEGGLEVWYFQQPQKIAAVAQENHPGNTSGDLEVKNRRDAWRIDGMSLDSNFLRVGSINASVSASLRLKKRVVVNLLVGKVDQTVVVADLNDIGVQITLKRPISFAMPTTIALKCVQKGGQAQLELTDSGKQALRDHFAKQLNDFLSEKSFDANFDHSFSGLSGPAYAAFSLFFDAKKGELLAELRSHLNAEMAKPAYFDVFLKDIARAFPIPLSQTDQTIELVMDRSNATADTWTVREKGAPIRFNASTLKEIPRSGLQRPSATVAIHAVRLSQLVAEYFSHSKDNRDLSKLSLSADNALLSYTPAGSERQEIAKWIASVDAPTDASASRVLAIEIAGTSAPVVQPWYVAAKGQQPQQAFFDLWISARWIDTANPSAPTPRLGLLLVFSLSPAGTLKLAQLCPYKPGRTTGPAVPLSETESFGRALGVKLEALFLQSLVNARLEVVSPQVGIKGIAGIRMLGNRGTRAPGEVLAEALAIDLTVR